MFGSSTAPATGGSLFGTPSAAKPAGGLFGAPTTSTTGGSLFGASSAAGTAGSGLFGNTATTTSAGGLFGASTAAKPAGGLFGATATSTTGGGLFGASSAGTTGTGLFGNTTTTSAGGGLFGASAAAKPAGGLLGSSTAGAGGGLFSSQPGGATGGGLFGGGSTGGGLFGNAQAAGAKPVTDEVRSLQAVVANAAAVTKAIGDPTLYGDDRDAVIAKLNQLLAVTGIGNGYFENGKTPVPFDKENIFYQFRAVGYCALSQYKDNDGVVSLVLNTPANTISTSQEKQKVVDALFVILGNDPNIHAHIVDVRPVTDTICEVEVYVSKRQYGRINARQLFQFFEQKDKKPALETQLKCLKVVPRVEMNKEDIQRYLSIPPKGFTDAEWQSAILNNPDPDNLIPYPIYGFKELSERRQRQVTESDVQRKAFNELTDRYKAISDEIEQINGFSSISRENIVCLRHRLLRIVAVLLLNKKQSASISLEEERLLGRLETISVCLNAPEKLKDRVENLDKKLSENKHALEARQNQTRVNTTLSDDEAMSLRRYLTRRQQDLDKLVESVQTDASDIGTMEKKAR